MKSSVNISKQKRDIPLREMPMQRFFVVTQNKGSIHESSYTVGAVGYVAKVGSSIVVNLFGEERGDCPVYVYCPGSVSLDKVIVRPLQEGDAITITLEG